MKKVSDLKSDSNDKVHWKCKNGHEWEARLQDRIHGKNCPFCLREKEHKGSGLLVVEFPELAKQLVIGKNGALSADKIAPNSSRKVWWKCDKGHEWFASVANRSRGSNCPYCAGKKVAAENSLLVRYPELAKQLCVDEDGNLASVTVACGSGKKMAWKCDKGHKWTAAVKDRVKGCGCPVCCGNRVSKDNCLSTVNPQLAAEWHPTKNGGLKPDNVTRGSSKKVWWICEKGHEWQAIVGSRSQGHGCPHCR